MNSDAVRRYGCRFTAFINNHLKIKIIMNSYLKMKEKHQKEMDDFPMFLAFNQKQFEEGMRKLNLEPANTGAIFKLGTTGGFIRKADDPGFSDMMERHLSEMRQAIDSDPTGEGFIFDMFHYELRNHEFGYTGEVYNTLSAVGLTWDDIKASGKLHTGLKNAMRSIREEEN
jgi:hypothetical protein